MQRSKNNQRRQSNICDASHKLEIDIDPHCRDFMEWNDHDWENCWLLDGFEYVPSYAPEFQFKALVITKFERLEIAFWGRYKKLFEADNEISINCMTFWFVWSEIEFRTLIDCLEIWVLNKFRWADWFDGWYWFFPICDGYFVFLLWDIQLHLYFLSYNLQIFEKQQRSDTSSGGPCFPAFCWTKIGGCRECHLCDASVTLCMWALCPVLRSTPIVRDDRENEQWLCMAIIREVLDIIQSRRANLCDSSFQIGSKMWKKKF
jgi:hypothetical protein